MAKKPYKWTRGQKLYISWLATLFTPICIVLNIVIGYNNGLPTTWSLPWVGIVVSLIVGPYGLYICYFGEESVKRSEKGSNVEFKHDTPASPQPEPNDDDPKP